jgi:hypothetical protein
MKLHWHIDGAARALFDEAWAHGWAAWLMGDLNIRKPVHFYLQGVWVEIDNDGLPKNETATTEFDHDGTAYDNNVVQVAINPRSIFPARWGPTGRAYLSGVAQLENAHELFIWLAAHELRHLWQWQNKKQARQLRSLLKVGDEMEADLYAARQLSAYKNQV